MYIIFQNPWGLLRDGRRYLIRQETTGKHNFRGFNSQNVIQFNRKSQDPMGNPNSQHGIQFNGKPQEKQNSQDAIQEIAGKAQFTGCDSIQQEIVGKIQFTGCDSI